MGEKKGKERIREGERGRVEGQGRGLVGRAEQRGRSHLTTTVIIQGCRVVAE